MKKLRNISPGEVLQEEFLKPLNISQAKISKELGITPTRISEIINGNRRISADTAVRLSAFFGNSPKFWLGLQNDYEIENELIKNSFDLKQINRLKIGDFIKF
ncbi:HigA family addiction module antitoxin [Sphingobacterium hungaricum]|uniref:Addiction module antidote protein, HigA family n=1 Tax=Sphingobacterium hungaricum TaxID=2082723 RepID=A0A928USZ8_9SPHI|nr:HigA family addiction module antitoxin [Sphingobacterium hungaricum]MBE8712771.1 addiction module antidote protein, HigA family [Sphingobacterium hungaricum]